MEVLNDNSMIISSKEVHALTIPNKIYELNKYRPMINFFLEKLQPNDRKARYLYILGKMCINEGCPLPNVQNYIFEQLF